ncbi:hypothetical protein PHLGIDRAFT_97222 [Phlebiopsis gigantea 11061_1 CR5-6]|uniref:Uncharacterized protein n=1 Tax=Phlebiopsis gigantea (strain 11061_1 CR5-6) TaxID=745531 RepID=A0A0C3SED9_PHLG1|nr:hypothetical protein PHLGIDRAFT_97222 [Phlebiopsis gigantea 11061_1 CR5-6]
MSPTAASSGRPHKPVPHGFLPSPRPKEHPISDMGVRELRHRHVQNMKKLEEAGPSTSTYVQRINAEQAAIESRLVELGVDDIQKMLSDTNLNVDEQMNVDGQSLPPNNPRPISAKQRALEKYSVRIKESNTKSNSVFTFQEAMEIEREAHRVEMERKREHEQKAEDRRRRMGLPQTGERALTREEQEARVYAFMNYKPTESDLEDDDDSDDEDPASWFEDDQDDGRKGQDIIEPDYEDYSEVIRIDTTHIPRNDLFDHDGD